jgi:hypothetical protein
MAYPERVGSRLQRENIGVACNVAANENPAETTLEARDYFIAKREGALYNPKMELRWRVIGPEEPFVCTIHFSGRVWYAQQAIGK